jgi:hypothetical protein
MSISPYDLVAAHCSNVACTSARVETLDSLSMVNFTSNALISPDGLGLLGYGGWDQEWLQLAHCANLECSRMDRTILPTAGDNGWSASIAVNDSDQLWVSYSDNFEVKVIFTTLAAPK